ncbi:MAG: hypothetical protein KAX16_04205 [Actinomycetia bacterium]|nr:hypothetical protein [Actinomycetes bacterium]
MSIFIETFGQEKVNLSHDGVVELINSAEGLTNKERQTLLADWGDVSGKGVGGQHIEALLPDEKEKEDKNKGKEQKKEKKPADEG